MLPVQLATFIADTSIASCDTQSLADAQAPPVKAQRVSKLPDTPPAQELIEKNKATCTAAVRNGMKDPGAANMGTVSRLSSDVDYFNGQTFNVVSYAANANGKNSYGGYTGEKLQICSSDPDERRIVRTS